MSDAKSWLNNREKKRQPKKSKGWCGCDMCVVEDNKKCPKCGRRNKSNRNKKN